MRKNALNKSERKPSRGWLTSQTILSLGNKSAPGSIYARSVAAQNMRRSDMHLPEHVTLCDQCGSAPVHDMTIPKWVFEQVGECFADCDCKPTEDASTDGQNLEN